MGLLCNSRGGSGQLFAYHVGCRVSLCSLTVCIESRPVGNQTCFMVPEALRHIDRWILWRSEDGRKVPYSIRGNRGNTHAPSFWSSYDACAERFADEPGEWSGLGFVLGDGICGVDLDNCLDDAGNLNADAREIVKECASYWEISPSGKGVKIVCTGDVPKGYKRKLPSGQTLEVYGQGRYFAITGQGKDRPLASIPPRLLVVPEPDSDAEPTDGRPPQYEDCLNAVLNLPPSIEHNGSHNAILTAACEILRWGLIGRHGLEVLKEYNRKKSFREDGETPYPWSASELKHKWQSAIEKTYGEIGCRLHESKVQGEADEFDELPADDVAAPTVHATKAKAEYVDYPIHVLEPEIQAYLEAQAKSIRTFPGVIAVPFMVSLGAVIGNRRWADLTGNWPVSPNIWAALVARPGMSKTTVGKAGMRFLSEIDKGMHNEWLSEMRDWEASGQSKENPKPKRRVLKVGDITAEALVTRFANAPNGLIVDADELTGWFNSIDRYSAQNGSHRPFWLSCWTGEEHLYDRETKEPPFIRLTRPIVSIFGSIQPKLLAETVYEVGREDGTLQRFLLYMPPAPDLGLLQRGAIPEEITAPISEAFYKIHELHSGFIDPITGEKVTTPSEQSPVFMHLTDEAWHLFQGWEFDLKTQVRAERDIYFCGHMDKLPVYVGRFATILEVTRWAFGRGSDTEISGESMRRAIEIIDWHQTESLRVYRYLAALNQQHRKGNRK